jgi:hypothetical protein
MASPSCLDKAKTLLILANAEKTNINEEDKILLAGALSAYSLLDKQLDYAASKIPNFRESSMNREVAK